MDGSLAVAGGDAGAAEPGGLRRGVKGHGVIVKGPGVMTIGRGNVAAHADFTLGASRVVHPRHPMSEADSALSAPSA